MLKLLDVLVQLDHLKNAKASIPNDFSWYKRYGNHLLSIYHFVISFFFFFWLTTIRGGEIRTQVLLHGRLGNTIELQGSIILVYHGYISLPLVEVGLSSIFSVCSFSC
jgi:hypothetical protein